MSAETTKKQNTTKKRNTESQLSKEQLIQAVKKKRECKAAANKIVEALLKTSTNPEEFLQMMKFINQCHYEDIVEERYILKLCGYPMCGNVLVDVPAKKYQISTTVNKVYDITYRKMFCSTTCFKASEYIKSQLLTSPLWLRDQEVVPEFVLMDGT